MPERKAASVEPVFQPLAVDPHFYLGRTGIGVDVSDGLETFEVNDESPFLWASPSTDPGASTKRHDGNLFFVGQHHQGRNLFQISWPGDHSRGVWYFVSL